MIVIGGAYRERCLRPDRQGLHGSGVTAAAFIATVGQAVTLHCCVDDEWRRELSALGHSYGFSVMPRRSEKTVSFRYDQPFAAPIIRPRPDAIVKVTLEVADDDALVFGMLDADITCTATRAVYDPQSPHRPRRFSECGTAAKLAYCLNAEELRLLVNDPDAVSGARRLLQEERAEVVVVKLGLSGALIVSGDEVHRVPAYRSGGAMTIGSGDIFAAAFARLWLRGTDAVEAADAASRATARYTVAGNAIDAALDEAPLDALAPWSGDVYIAAPFFTLAERALLEDVVDSVLGISGLRPRSPLHEVGVGDPVTIARGDLELLRACGRVLAILDGRDPGTLFEVGYAVRNGIPVFAASTSTRDAPLDRGELRMIVGSEVPVYRDFAEALVAVATA